MDCLSHDFDNNPAPGDALDSRFIRPYALAWFFEWLPVAAGDQLALHALYERAQRSVFTLTMRVTANRETAEELTIDVLHDVWRRAARYDVIIEVNT